MDRLIVVHYNELGLKKGNRDFFENRLCESIRSVLADCGGATTRRLSGRILVELKPAADMKTAIERLRNVFGIAYFAEARRVAASLEDFERTAGELAGQRAFASFRIDARRADKSFPHNSVAINTRVGAYVQQRSGARVDLEDAEWTCAIEVLGREALIYTDRIAGPGGLPAGTGGRVVVLLSGGIDSPVAAWKMIKRGCTAIFAHFHSFPYTNAESQEKAKRIASLLATYQLRSKIYLIPFAEIQRHIMVGAPAEMRVILYRRYMMRLAERIAQRERARVLVTGDSVGQVASQTIENIDVISRAVTMPILRPLVGDDKLEIIAIAQRIGSFEISIQPDQDCCSLFVPKHPETRAKLETTVAAESRLDVDAAISEALANSEVLRLYPSWQETTTPAPQPAEPV
ncbi:MAG TPA: tRNA uracil 4-sulfurtransferase ThiI [Terriglobia bacterium]|nr:tRNA uracil 4-sulfurtransferase ThiI [Terriglobia bacterium]